MANLIDWITKAAKGELIEAVVIGRAYHEYLDELDDEGKSKVPRFVVLPWAEAREWLDYEFDDGFGGADCHPIYAWTATRVMMIGEYDGSTRLEVVPRHPVACEPEYM